MTDLFVFPSVRPGPTMPCAKAGHFLVLGSLPLPTASGMVCQYLWPVPSVLGGHLWMGFVRGTLNLFLQPILPSAILRNLWGEISHRYIWQLASKVTIYSPLRKCDCDVQWLCVWNVCVCETGKNVIWLFMGLSATMWGSVKLANGFQYFWKIWSHVNLYQSAYQIIESHSSKM